VYASEVVVGVVCCCSPPPPPPGAIVWPAQSYYSTKDLVTGRYKAHKLKGEEVAHVEQVREGGRVCGFEAQRACVREGQDGVRMSHCCCCSLWGSLLCAACPEPLRGLGWVANVIAV
jgi:hypothetical protein